MREAPWPGHQPEVAFLSDAVLRLAIRVKLSLDRATVIRALLAFCSACVLGSRERPTRSNNVTECQAKTGFATELLPWLGQIGCSEMKSSESAGSCPSAPLATDLICFVWIARPWCPLLLCCQSLILSRDRMRTRAVPGPVPVTTFYQGERG